MLFLMISINCLLFKLYFSINSLHTVYIWYFQYLTLLGPWCCYFFLLTFTYGNLLSYAVCVCCFLCYDHILHITLGLFHLLDKLNLIACSVKIEVLTRKYFHLQRICVFYHLWYKGCSQPYGVKWNHFSSILNLRFSFPSLWGPRVISDSS